MTISAILDELSKMEGPLAERYKKDKRELFNEFKSFPIALLDRLRVHTGELSDRWRIISSLVDCLDKNGNRITGRWAGHEGCKLAIDEDRLERCAARFAKDQIDVLRIKMAQKLHKVDSVSNIRANVYNFEITFNAKLGDHNVHISQSMIFQTSKYGKLFARWPLLIWVDGKKISEAKFKKL